MIQFVAPPAGRAASKSPVSLHLAEQLFEQLNSRGVRYCQWKSNQALRRALAGTGDLDLLVHSEDTARFHAILECLGFKPCAQPAWQRQVSVVHYYGHDAATGCLLHLHIYYRLVTGGHLLKNYRLPLEQLLLTSVEQRDGVTVPTAAAELTVFVIRKLLEASNFCELALQRRDRAHLERELHGLLPNDVAERRKRLEDVRQILERHLPQLPFATWQAGVDSLLARSSMIHQHRIGCRFRRALQSLSIYGRCRQMWSIASRLAFAARSDCRAQSPGNGSTVVVVSSRLSARKQVGNPLCPMRFFVGWLRLWLPRPYILANRPPLCPAGVPMQFGVCCVGSHEKAVAASNAAIRDGWATPQKHQN